MTQRLFLPLCALILAFAKAAHAAPTPPAPTQPPLIVRGGGGSVAFDRATGRILSIRSQPSATAVVAATPPGGDLWSLQLRGGQTLRASDCLKNALLKIRRTGPETLDFTYAARQGGTVTVHATGSTTGIDLRLSVHALPDDVLGVALPDDLSFAPTTLRRVLFPEHLGIALKPSFFQAHPTPISWTGVSDGPEGLQRVANLSCRMPPDGQPPIAVHATDLARRILGNDLATAWESQPQIVDRPSAQQPDEPLLASDAGEFLGGHIVGQGLLLRFGGRLSLNQSPLLLPTIEKLVAALAQSPSAFDPTLPPKARSRVVMIEPQYASGATPAVSFTTDDLRNAFTSAGLNLPVSTAATPDAVLSALSDPSTLAVVNPYGESFLSGDDWHAMLDAIHAYLNSGGAWLETGGYSFYYHLQGNSYASLEDHYPSRSFDDFARMETVTGSLSEYGVQNAADPRLILTDSNWRAYGDTAGGHLRREWQTFLPKTTGGETPTLRLRLSDPDAASALRTYAKANGIIRPLTAKMPVAVLALWKRCLTIKLVTSTVDEETAMLSGLPAPAVLHEVSYLHGGFDRQYPDHLPPNPKYGTPEQFRHFLALAHQKGDLIMPYTNTTWWPDNPKGPTFQAIGDAPLLIGLDNQPRHEAYGPGSSGWSITPFHPAVTASVDRLVKQFTQDYPVDILFGDQNGARGLEYDLNPASPTPSAYTQGMIDLAARAAKTLPVATEDGFDHLANVESEFCGLTQELVPFQYDRTQLLSRRLADSDWEFFPMAEYVAHDKAIFIHHDLGEGVWNGEALAWTLALGYGLTKSTSAADLANPASKNWLDYLSRLQRALGPAYMGAPLLTFRYLTGSGSQGVMEAVYGRMRVISNLTSSEYDAQGVSVPAHGFRAKVGGTITTSPSPTTP